jgi:hypothetical protein
MLHFSSAEENSSVFTADYVVTYFWLKSERPKNSVTIISVTRVHFILQSSAMVLRPMHGITENLYSHVGLPRFPEDQNDLLYLVSFMRWKDGNLCNEYL